MNTAKRVAVNTGFLYARMAITVFISLYSTRLILNALGAEDFGLFNVVGGAIAMLSFLNNAMAGATQRFMSYSQGEGDLEKQKSIFNVSTILHFIIAILVVLLLEGAGYLLFNGILNIPADRIEVAKLIFHFMLASTFFTIISVPYDAVINAHENMLLVAILGVVEALVKLSIAIYITQTHFDKLVSYGILMAALSIFLLIIRRIYCHRKYQEVVINFKAYFSKPLFREMTGFAGWSFLGASTSLIANYGQGIVINVFFGTIVNAAQGVAGQVSGQLGAFASTMLKALNPIIDKSEGAGNRSLMLKASMMGSKISFFLLMFFYIPVIIEMPLILKLWLKEVPEFTLIFCKLLLVRNLIEQLFQPISSSIAAVGKIKKFQTYISILNLVPLFICYLLFYYGYSPSSLYVVYIFSSIVNGGITLYFARKDCGLSFSVFFNEVVFKCIGSLIMISIISSIPLLFIPDGIFRVLIVFFISSVSFIAAVWIFGLDQIEKANIRKIIKL
jgi:O-antigen/teichoic acid export membrane protein